MGPGLERALCVFLEGMPAGDSLLKRTLISKPIPSMDFGNQRILMGCKWAL